MRIHTLPGPCLAHLVCPSLAPAWHILSCSLPPSFYSFDNTCGPLRMDIALHLPVAMSVRALLAIVAIMALAMMEASRERKELVKELRKVARRAGVQLVRDDAGKEKITTMMDGIRAATNVEPAAKRGAESAFQRYLATYRKAPTLEKKGQEAFRMRGKSFLLTYNWDFLGEACPDGTPKASNVDDLWHRWCAWKEAVTQTLGVKQSTSTIEASLRSENVNRVHIHWKINLNQAVDQSTTKGFNFRGVRPDVRGTMVPVERGRRKPRGVNFLEASNRAHFYTWAPKEGSLRVDTNYAPFSEYRVLGKWLEDLYTAGKLTHKVYEDLSLRVRVGHSSRMRDSQVVVAREKERAVDEHMAQVDAALAQLRAPFRRFPEVEAWEDSFLKLDFRWKLLVLVADSASGKSSFAESLFERPFILTVESAVHLDLKAFDRDVNDGLVLDNVNTWEQLLRWRAVLQARNAKSWGGQSATNMFAYVQYLFGVAVVATIDLDAPDSHLVNPGHAQASNWLLKNCVIVRLPAGDAFFDRSAMPDAIVENTFSRFAETVKRRRLAK